MELRPVNLKELARAIEGPWRVREVARIMGVALRLARVEGEYHWHVHTHEDEMFIVLDGEMSVDTEEGTVDLGPWDAFLVPAGVRHRSRSRTGALILLVEPISTITTGEPTK